MTRFLNVDEIDTAEPGDRAIGWHVGKRTSKECIYVKCPDCGIEKWVITGYRDDAPIRPCRKCWGKRVTTRLKEEHRIGRKMPGYEVRTTIAKCAAEGKPIPKKITGKNLRQPAKTWHTAIKDAWQTVDANLPAIIEKLCETALGGDLEAIKEVLNRRFGKVKEHIDVETSGKFYLTAETVAQALARLQEEEKELKNVKEPAAICGASGEGSSEGKG